MLCRYPWRRKIAAIRYSQRTSYSTTRSDQDEEQPQKKEILPPYDLNKWRSQVRVLFEKPGWEFPPPRLLWVGGRLAVPAAGVIHDCLRATTLISSRGQQAFNIISGLRNLRYNTEVRGQAHLVDVKPRTRWRVIEMMVELAINQEHKDQDVMQKGAVQSNPWSERALTLLKSEKFTVDEAEGFVKKLMAEGKEYMAALILVEALWRYRSSVLSLKGAFDALLRRVAVTAVGPESTSRQQAILTVCHLTSFLQKVGYPDGWNTNALVDAVWALREHTDLVWILDPTTSFRSSQQVTLRWHMLTTLCRLDDKTHLLTISPPTTLYMSLLIDLLETHPPPSNWYYSTGFRKPKSEIFSVALEAEELWRRCLYYKSESTRDEKMLADWLAQVRARLTEPRKFDVVVRRVEPLLKAVHQGRSTSLLLSPVPAKGVIFYTKKEKRRKKRTRKFYSRLRKRSSGMMKEPLFFEELPSCRN
ncbi:hypothetical protein BDZ89DRAFT_574547 [Hymenopellis radicata]|nr:hypothetical protein BDZ89DRAFT_574547 [Hymenopellis radicata]